MISQDIRIYLLIIAVALVTYSSRLIGFFLGLSIKPNNPLFEYANYITYALIAALSFKLIFVPVGALEQLSILWRGLATLGCLIAYLLHRKYLLMYLFATILLLTLIQYL